MPAGTREERRPLLGASDPPPPSCCSGWADGQDLFEEPAPAGRPGAVGQRTDGAGWFHSRLVARRPRLAGVLLPALLVHLFWWSYILPRHQLALFTARAAGGSGVPGYWMSVTMVFGSLVAGATSVGGAAVAFPVMTLAFDIAPSVALGLGWGIGAFVTVAGAAVLLLCACGGVWIAFLFDERKFGLACGAVCLALGGAALGLGWWLGAFGDAGSFSGSS